MATTLNINIPFSEVVESVGMNSAYVGDRYVGDEGAYVRISTTSGDIALLEEYFMECRGPVLSILQPYLSSVTWNTAGCIMTCEFPDRVPSDAIESVPTHLRSFLVSYLLSKWYVITNKAGAEAEALVAKGYLDGMLEAVSSRKRPTRVVPQKS